jgi:hypothetical protein
MSKHTPIKETLLNSVIHLESAFNEHYPNLISAAMADDGIHAIQQLRDILELVEQQRSALETAKRYLALIPAAGPDIGDKVSKAQLGIAHHVASKALELRV